eukprot:3322320-Prymnesium_polylepis.1
MRNPTLNQTHAESDSQSNFMRNPPHAESDSHGWTRFEGLRLIDSFLRGHMVTWNGQLEWSRDHVRHVVLRNSRRGGAISCRMRASCHMRAERASAAHPTETPLTSSPFDLRFIRKACGPRRSPPTV